MPTKRRDPHAVVHWRLGQLVQAGLPRPLAARVARDERYDLHELIALVERGCAPALAVRILEPTDVSREERQFRTGVPGGIPTRTRQRPPQA